MWFPHLIVDYIELTQSEAWKLRVIFILLISYSNLLSCRTNTSTVPGVFYTFQIFRLLIFLKILSYI